MRFKWKLFTDASGNPEVKFEEPDSDGEPEYWTEEGQLRFLQVIADDPDSNLEELEDGVYWMPKYQ